MDYKYQRRSSFPKYLKQYKKKSLRKTKKRTTNVMRQSKRPLFTPLYAQLGNMKQSQFQTFVCQGMYNSQVYNNTTNYYNVATIYLNQICTIPIASQQAPFFYISQNTLNTGTKYTLGAVPYINEIQNIFNYGEVVGIDMEFEFINTSTSDICIYGQLWTQDTVVYSPSGGIASATNETQSLSPYQKMGILQQVGAGGGKNNFKFKLKTNRMKELTGLDPGDPKAQFQLSLASATDTCQYVIDMALVPNAISTYLVKYKIAYVVRVYEQSNKYANEQ